MSDAGKGTEIAQRPPRAMIRVSEVNPISMMFDPDQSERVMQIAKTLAGSHCTVPDHLKGNLGDCVSIVMQAATFKLNPWAVAQKTHIVGGRLGYEAQLLNAVATTQKVIEGRFDYRFIGDWSKVAKRPIKKLSQNNKEYMTPGWKEEDEEGLGVIVSAKLRDTGKVKDHELWLTMCWPRNSTLWAINPKMQISYLAVKQWMRLYAPDAVLGVYTVDELQEERVIEGEVIRDEGPAGGLSPLDSIRSRASVIEAESRRVQNEEPPEEEPQESKARGGSPAWPREINGVLCDSRGMPWNELIHSSNKICNSRDGVWRRRKGVDDKLAAKIEKGMQLMPLEPEDPEVEPDPPEDQGPEEESGDAPLYTLTDVLAWIEDETDEDGLDDIQDVSRNICKNDEEAERVDAAIEARRKQLGL